MVMKYIFTATYKDGSTYIQNMEDVSVSDEKRSCFFDVDKDNLKTFRLDGDGHSYLVNLEDGHFEVDGVSFLLHEEPLEAFKIIYFRRHRHHYQAGAETSHEMVYRLGWQSGSEQRVMQIE